MQFKPKTEHDRGCPKTYKVSYDGIPRCICGVTDPSWNPPDFYITPKDIEKWNKDARNLFHVFKDGEIHEKQEWMRRIGITEYPSKVVSNLRDMGAVIPRAKRDGKFTYYQMTDFVDHSTISKGIHYPDCKTCRCTGGS